ncbi:MAG: glutathione-disulfide reductase, partial [Rhodospirillales bacterium]|nr:glutathione-disulfide reductase [Rhodospirillales bacterium]
MDFDLFVIGGGSAGVRCARIAAGHGAKVGVAEERFWGGTCVNIGCVPKKLLVQAGEYGAWAEDAAGFGWTIRKGPHDWAKLIAAKDREIARLEGIYRKLLAGAGAQVFDARATFIDAHTLDVGGQRITAERIVIATGGHPERPAIPGADLGIVSDDAFYLERMPQHVTIVGSGYIAVEFAGIFRALGAETHLVYRQPLPLRGFDHDLREALAEALQAQGVILHPNTRPTAVAADGERRILSFGEGETITTDLVFFATGRRPATERLGLEQAGIRTGAAGAVLVDDHLRTTQPHVYAIGDVTNRVNLTPVATAEGHALADSLFGKTPRSISLVNVPSAVFSTPPIATVGLTEEQAAACGPADVYVARFTPMRHTLTGRARKTLMKLVVDQATQKVVGAHML